MGVGALGRPGLKSLREYSIDTLFELGKTLPVLKCDISKFTGDAWRAQLVRPPGRLDNDVVFPADFPKMSRRKRSDVPDYRLHHAERGARGQQGSRKKMPPRLRSPATAALSIKIPPPYSGDRENGFEEFLETVPSPTNKRVTAGGRVVPAAPGSVSPVAASKKAISSPVLRALQEASPLFVQSAPGCTPVVYQPIGSVHGYDSQPYGESFEHHQQGLGCVPILGEAEAWQRAFPHSISRANCPFAPASESPLGNITNTGAAAPTTQWPSPYRTFEEQGPHLSEKRRGPTAKTAEIADGKANLSTWDSSKMPPPSTLELLQNAQMATLERARFLEMQSEMARLRRVNEAALTGSANCLQPQNWHWASSNLASDGRVFMSSLPVNPAYPLMSQPGWPSAEHVGFASAYPPSNVHPYHQLYGGQIDPRGATPGGPFAASHLQFQYAAANQYPVGMYDGTNDVNPRQNIAPEYAGTIYPVAGTPYTFGFDGSVEAFYDADEDASAISNGSQEARCPDTYLADWGFSPSEQLQPSTKVQGKQGSHMVPQQNDDVFDGLCDEDLLVDVESSLETHTWDVKQRSSESEDGALHDMSMPDEAVVIESTAESKRQHENTPETEPDQLILGDHKVGRKIHRPRRHPRTRKGKPAPKSSNFVSDLIDMGVSATGLMSRSAAFSDEKAAEAKLRQIQAKDEEKKCGGEELHADKDENQSLRETSPERQSESFLQEMLKNPRYSKQASTGSSEEMDNVAKGDQSADRSESDAGSTSDDEEAPVDAGPGRHSPSDSDGGGSNASGGTGPFATACSEKSAASAASTDLFPLPPESSTGSSDHWGLSRAAHHREVMEFFDRIKREEDEEIAKYRRQHPW